MTLQDLRDILSEALSAAYKKRDTIPRSHAYADCLQALESNIQLLVLLDEGVRKVQEKQTQQQARPTKCVPSNWPYPAEDF